MTAESTPLRPAIVGPGYIGAVHIEALRRIGAEVALIVGRPGADGGLDWNQEQPNTLTVRRRAAAEVVVKDPLNLAPEAAALARFPGGHPEGYPDVFRNLLASIYDAIARVRRGEAAGKEYPTVADGCRGVALVEAALRRAQERRWVAVA